MQSEEFPLSETLPLSGSHLFVADNAKTVRMLSVLILGIAVIAYIAMFFDPTTGGTTSLAYLQSMSDAHAPKGIVHGLAIAAAIANMVGYMLAAISLRRTGPLILIGMLVYFAGNTAIAVASFLDGFVAPRIAIAFASASVDDIEFAFRALGFMGIAMTTLAHIGWLLQGGAMLLLASSFSSAKKNKRPIKVAFIWVGVFVGVICIFTFLFLPFFPRTAIKIIMTGTMLGSFLLAAFLWFSCCRPDFFHQSQS